MTDHDGCLDELRDRLAAACASVGEPDMDLHISTEPPLVATGRWAPQLIPATCPHGTTYWIEPTGDQRARWAAEAAP